MNEAIKVQAWDGFPLAVTHFIPEQPNGKVVLINSATAVKQQYYQDFATYLAAQGFHAYTFDYRGIGASRPAKLRRLKSDMKDWAVLDIDAVISYISGVHTSLRLVIMGHSVGGQLIGMSRLAHKAEAFVMIGSQTPYWKNYDGSFIKLKLLSLWYFVIPFFTTLAGYFPASKLGLFEDLPGNVARQWARWAKTKNYVFEDHPELKNNFESFEQRALMISFSDDSIAPKKAVLDLKQHFTRLKLEHWHLQPDDVLQKHVGHFGFFKKRMEDVLWYDTIKWIKTGMPSQKSKAA